jgi:DNA-binding transcriptional LysR family regulator
MANRLRPIDLVELRGLCLAIELGSLGRAAEAMGISQPALSKRMRELELFAGTPLLDRSPRGVAPTAAGEVLYREARGLLTRADHVEEVLDNLRGTRAPVRLAASHTIAEYLLPGALVDLQDALGAGFALELVAANSTVVRDLVREGRADLGLAAALPTTGPGERDPRGDGLRELTVCEDEVMVAVTAGHPWASQHAIALPVFAATPLVMRDPTSNARQLLDRALAARGLSLAPPLAEVGSSGAAIAAASAGRAPAVLSRLAIAAAAPILVARRVQGLDLHRRFVLVTRTGQPPSPPARLLADHLLARLGEHNQGLSRPTAGTP